MCWEDMQIGRSLESQAKSVTIPAGQTVVLATADTRRTRIGFANAGSALCFVGCEGFTLAVDRGFYTAQTVPPLLFTVEEYGQLVCGEWRGTNDGSNVDIIVTTQTLRDNK